MRFDVENPHSKGIYAIGDLKTCEVVYIGSTTATFRGRYYDHKYCLEKTTIETNVFSASSINAQISFAL